MNLLTISQKLTSLPLFKNFEIEEIYNILNKINYQLKYFNKNEIIFFRGDPIEHIIILLDGETRGEMQKFNGDSIIIDHMLPIQVIASIFIFGNTKEFPVDFIASKKSTLLLLSKKDFLNELTKNSKLTLNFLNEISNKGQNLSKRIWFNFTHKTIQEKLLSYIKENQKNNTIIFKPNISELAKKFEITRPSLSREISILCEKGVLSKIKNNKYNVDLSNMKLK